MGAWHFSCPVNPCCLLKTFYFLHNVSSFFLSSTIWAASCTLKHLGGTLPARWQASWQNQEWMCGQKAFFSPCLHCRHRAACSVAFEVREERHTEVWYTESDGDARYWSLVVVWVSFFFFFFLDWQTSDLILWSLRLQHVWSFLRIEMMI